MKTALITHLAKLFEVISDVGLRSFWVNATNKNLLDGFPTSSCLRFLGVDVSAM